MTLKVVQALRHYGPRHKEAFITPVSCDYVLLVDLNGSIQSRDTMI